MASIRSRIDVLRNVNSKISPRKDSLCIQNNFLSKKLKIIRRIGTSSINGETFLGQILPQKDNIQVAVKKIPMRKFDLQYTESPYTLEAIINSSVWAELYFLRMVSLLVRKNITPNLPLLYKYFVCNNCKFENEKVIKHYGDVKRCLLVINEIADGDFKEVLQGKAYGVDELLTYYFQIYIGIYCIRKYFNLWHHDLHYGNVLYHIVKPGGFIHYIVDGNDIYIPNFGLIFVLWDFGYARIPGIVENKELRHIYKRETDPYEDYHRITHMAKSRKNKISNEVYKKLRNIIERYTDRSQMSMIKHLGNEINKIYGSVTKESLKGEKIYGPFDTDTEL
jgi:hypothetical protein